MKDDAKIVFFDGYCGLCNAAVDWLIRVDKNGALKFASLQGQTAARVLGERSKASDPDTVVYARGAETFERSSAALRILADVGGPWAWAKVFLLVPKPLRDFVYRVVARNRHRIMRPRDSCRVPSASEAERLLP